MSEQRVGPSLLEPLSIEIDKAKFETKKAQGPPRMMSAEKDAHMEKFITEGLKSNVIRPSNARYYSQVRLVVKPEADATTIKTNASYSTGYDGASNAAQAMLIDDKNSQSSEPQGNAKSKSTTPQARSALSTPNPPRKWRTTIDYIHYNDCIVKQHWPLPNISVMKERIGKAKPKCFAKLDMANGYWQAPLAEYSKAYTAFICFMGIFEWNRAPIGTQPAGGYFQQMIAFVVLLGLTYKILESYIDDIFVHAQTKGGEVV